MTNTIKLVLLRHGETQYNVDKIFTGWTDIGMTQKGEADCKMAGEILKKNNYSFDVAYTSILKRSIKTAWIALESMGQMWVPIKHSWRLNERHYGALQGIGHAQMQDKYGDGQVFLWRRSFEIRPPKLDRKDPRYTGNLPQYAGLKNSEKPLGESLKDTIKRVMPFWKSDIAPAIKSGKSVLICAHGNSLRAIVKNLDNISDEDIPKLEIATGKPLVYELNKNLVPLKHYYLE